MRLRVLVILPVSDSPAAVNENLGSPLSILIISPQAQSHTFQNPLTLARPVPDLKHHMASDHHRRFGPTSVRHLPGRLAATFTDLGFPIKRPPGDARKIPHIIPQASPTR